MIRRGRKRAGSTGRELTIEQAGRVAGIAAVAFSAVMVTVNGATAAGAKHVHVAQNAPSTERQPDAPAPVRSTSQAAPASPTANYGVPAPSTPGMPPIPGSGQPGAPALPGAVTPTPGSTATPPAPAVTITLDQAIATALNNNSAVALARERLRKAQEQIRQAFASALPQIGASLADTYSSQKSFAAGGGSTTSNVTIPGGGVIPTVVDQSGVSGTFFSGGGGNAIGTGQPSTTGTAPIPSGGTTPAPAGTTTAPGTTTSPGSTAPGGAGSGSTGTGSGQAAPGPMFATADSFPVQVAMVDNSSGLPPMLEQYAAAENGSRSLPVNAHTLQSHAVGGGNSGNNFSNGGHNNYAVRLSVNQAIDIFGLVPAGVDVLRRTRDFYAIDLDRVSNELALTVKSDYFTILRDEANVAADEEQVRSATENVRITTAKFNEGQAARYDVLTAQTTLANDTQTLISAQNQLAIDRANLNSLLGVPLDEALGLTTPALPPLDQPIDLGAAVTTAYSNRPELRQAENNIAIAKRLVRLSGAGLLPSLTLTGSASHNGPSYPNVAADDYLVTANLAIPIYDGGVTQSKVQSAKSDLRTQEITRAQLRQNVTLEVRQAYLNTMSARSAVGAAQAGVTQAADAARLAEVRFRTGVGTFLDVINAEAQLATARTNLATAEFQYQTSLAQLTRAEGGR